MSGCNTKNNKKASQAKSTSQAGGDTAGCPLANAAAEDKELEGRFGKEKVKCGDSVDLIGEGKNLADGTTFSFSLKALPGGGAAGSESGSKPGSQSVTVPWISKKTGNNWPEKEVEFEVAADGLKAKSENQLGFHKYEDESSATKTIRCRSGRFGWTGKFDIEFKSGVVIVTVKIKLINRQGGKPASGDPMPAAGPAVSAADKSSMKSDIEGKLSEKWLFHRDDCKRNDGCDCPKDRKCCKFKVKIVVEFVESGEHHEVNLFQGSGRANATNWTRVKTRDNSWAHETGHLLAWYDEYTGGAVGTAPRWKDPRNGAVMNTGLDVPKEYYWDFRDWFKSKMSEDWELLSP